MELKQLKTLVNEGYSIRQIGEETSKSATSIRYWLKKHGLKTKIPQFNRGGISNRNRKTAGPYICKACGENNPDNFYKRRQRCKTCHNIQQMERVNESKKHAVAYKGGKCEECNYRKNYAAFEFHHVNPKEKDLNWTTSRHWSWERLKVELDKCQLLCCRCHRELHCPEHEIKD